MADEEEEEEELLEVEYKLGDYFADLDVDEEHIQKHMSEQASNYVYYARVAAFQKKKFLRAKLTLERFEAVRSKEIRQENSSLGYKVTNQIVQDEVRATLEWKRLSEKAIDDRANSELTSGIAEGFFQRKSMVEGFGRILLREMSGESRVLKSEVEKYKKKLRTE